MFGLFQKKGPAAPVDDDKRAAAAAKMLANSGIAIRRATSPKPRAKSPVSPGSRRSSGESSAPTQLAAGANKIRDDEWASLFRNNLLRYCWVPGRKNEEVQKILAMWEMKLLEMMHRWVHPEIWASFKRWKLRKRRIMKQVINKFRKQAPFEKLRLNAREKKRYKRWLSSGFTKRPMKKVLNKWVEFTMERFELRVRAMRAANNIRLPYRKYINQWLYHNEAQEPLRVIFARWMNANKYAKFRFWAYEISAKLAKVKAALGHWRNGAKSKAINKLKAVLANFYILQRSAVRMRQRNLVKGHNTWSEWAWARAEWKLKVGAIFDTLRGGKKRAGFNSWREVWASKNALTNPLAKGMAHWMNRELSGALNHWRPIAALRVKLKAALMRMINAKVSKAMNTMRARAAELMERKRKLKEAANELMGKGYNRAFLSWVEFAETRAERARRLRSAAADLMGKGYRKAWFAWLEMLGRMQLMYKAVAAILKSRERRGLNMWIIRCAEADAAQAARSKVVSVMRGCKQFFVRMAAEAELRRKLRRGVAGMINRPAIKAMNKWSDDAKTGKERRRKLKEALDEMRGAGYNRAWNAWVEFHCERQRMAISLRRMINSGLSRGLGSWVAWVLERLEMEEKLAAALARLSPEGRAKTAALNTWVEFHAERMLMLKGLMGMLAAQLKKGYNAWRAFAEERIANEQRIGACLARMSHGCAKAFFSWREKANSPVDHTTRALLFLKNRKLVPAWNKWSAVHAEKMRLLYAVRGFVGGPIKRALFNWYSAALDELAKREKIAAALAGMTPEGRAKRAATNSWKARYAEDQALRRGLAFFRNRKLVPGYNAWVAYAEERAAKQARAKAALSRMTPEGRAKTKALNLLKEIVAERQRIAAALKSFTPEGRAKRGGFNSWKARVQEDDVMRRGAAFFANRKIVPGYNAWIAYAQERAAKMARAKAALKRMTPEGRAKTKALNRLKEVVAERKKLLRGASTFKNSAARKAFNKLAEALNRGPDPRLLALGHWRRQKLSRAFGGWVHDQLRELELLKAAELAASEVEAAMMAEGGGLNFDSDDDDYERWAAADRKELLRASLKTWRKAAAAVKVARREKDQQRSLQSYISNTYEVRAGLPHGGQPTPSTPGKKAPRRASPAREGHPLETAGGPGWRCPDCNRSKICSMDCVRITGATGRPSMGGRLSMGGRA